MVLTQELNLKINIHPRLIQPNTTLNLKSFATLTASRCCHRRWPRA